MKAAHPEVLAVPRVNPGETLRKARESRGWTIAEVAAQLNLTPQRLGQVEQGAFDKLPGHTFARGYVRAYAKLLEVDQNRLVLEFDHFTGSDAAGSSVHSLGRIEEPVSYSQRILRMVSFVLLLALAGFSFFWWQEQAERRAGDLASTSLEHVEVDGADGTTQIHPLDEPEDQAVEAAQLDTEVALPLLSDAAVLPSAVGSEATAVAPQPEQPQTLAETASVAVAPVASANNTPVVAESVPATPVATAPLPAAAGEAVVSLTFIADCWTQLTDANGKVLFSALKRKGDSLQLAGKAPLELRLGYARGVQVSLNGNPVDVAPFISGETARMKLGGQ
ncbi:MAG: helix-turn-helix domain-containing protein [Gammaproteobacteria bacterium]|nr:helix-turn-helix domain-containing protein [Gammaproteobacteria bacterium]MBU2157739.1 helix-turn-helix domain-containing protein [Gammaproteobacteria bacterium]MBU2253959.1 helix-turn-helix domain-containing protein [Gammaproteobacteria bacterium]MBU2296298.1 helix-turn-helix domain-containing protein [Gammaproteobacteria bacterium]